MANETQMTARLYSVTTLGAYTPTTTYTATRAISGSDLSSATQVIPTVDTALLIPASVATPYRLLLANLDGANFVEFGFVAATYVGKIPFGEFLLIPHFTGSVFLKANGGSVTLQVTCVEV